MPTLNLHAGANLLVYIFFTIWVGASAHGFESESADEACLMVEQTMHEDTRDSYQAALQIESRKQGLPLHWAPTTKANDCNANSALLFISHKDTAELRYPGRASSHFDLKPMEAQSRARTLASGVLAAIIHHEGQTLPLLDTEKISVETLNEENIEFEMLDAERASTARPLGWTLQAGTSVLALSERKMMTGTSISAGLTLFKQRMIIELTGSYLWGVSALLSEAERERMQADVRWGAGELIGAIRGGQTIGRWVLRGGGGFGQQFGTVTYLFDPEFSEEKEKEKEKEREFTSSSFATIQGELTYRINPHWHLTLLVAPRIQWESDERVSFAQHVRLQLGLQR